MKTLWLSHSLDEDTPLYGGAKDISISKLKNIKEGDSCNAGHISLPFHSGTHVDTPLHFIDGARSICEYDSDEWIFENPAFIELDVKEGQVINENDFDCQIDSNCDFIIIKTGFEKHRGKDRYWESGPCISDVCAIYLKDKYVNLRAIGFDFISISSLKHREIGRIAHKAFLGLDILIFEDMSLYRINSKTSLKKVIALPLRIENCEGSPATVIGIL